MIAELSKNDEAVVIGNRIREVYNGLDKDILTASGVEKGGSEKTYDYAKRVIGDLKKGGDQTALKAEVESLTKERDELAQKVKAGSGDEALKGELAKLQQQLSDKNSELEAARDSAVKIKEEFEAKIKETKANNHRMSVDGRFDGILSGFQVKDGTPDSVLKVMSKNAKETLFDKYTIDIEGDHMVFRGEDGQIVRNTDNLGRPFTATELLQAEMKDIIEVGSKQTGTGTQPNGSGKGKTGSFNLNATSQVEATTQIKNHLATKGVAKTDPSYQEKFNEIWTSNAEVITALPEQ